MKDDNINRDNAEHDDDDDDNQAAPVYTTRYTYGGSSGRSHYKH